jgi:hypothetical protein
MTNKIFFPKIHPKKSGCMLWYENMIITFMFHENCEATVVTNVVCGMETSYTHILHVILFHSSIKD